MKNKHAKYPFFFVFSY